MVNGTARYHEKHNLSVHYTQWLQIWTKRGCKVSRRLYYCSSCQTIQAYPPGGLSNVRFKAQVANKWVVGRTMVAGDAAHNFPPFGGQGIASGFRDSLALAWRLSLITQHPEIDYEGLLTGWYIERKQQVEVCKNISHSQLMLALASTVFNGGLVCQRSWFWSAVRNALVRSLSMIPPIKKKLEMGPRGIMMRYKFLLHSCFLDDREGGVFIPQIHIWQGQEHRFSDDVIFEKGKRGIFQLVVLVDTAPEARFYEREVEGAELDTLSGGLICSAETTYIIHKERSLDNLPDNFVLAMSKNEYDEMGYTPPLREYDKERIKREFPWKRFLVVRPDRYTFGTAIAADGVQDIARRAKQMILEKKK